MKEIWKDIKGYEGLYQVSNFGRVKGLDRQILGKNGVVQSVRGRVLTPKRDGKDNYHMVALRKDGGAKYLLIHRLVAQTFIPNPENKSQVNHINGDKKNNHVDNLEWVTPSENIQHAYDTNLREENKQVYQVDRLTREVVDLFNSIQQASRVTGVNHSTIADSMNKRYKESGQYLWIGQDEVDRFGFNIPISERLEGSDILQQLTKDGTLVKEYLCLKDASEKTGILITALSNCVQGISKTSGGFVWKYKYR